MNTDPPMAPLSPERWRQVDDLLAAALDRPPDERTAFLRSECGHDVALYDAVTALLDREAESERVLGEFASVFAAPLLHDLAGEGAEPAPESAGPYRILREIGRGGMGTVFLAERADGAFTRRVALKLVRRGMDTDDVLRRFDAERRILAVLDHPNVARILDAGATADGRPYFAMEYVEGEPLTGYCDERRLGVDARIRLFESVCDAVQHAHRHLVVHRDLKPTNVLVADAVVDAGGTPEPMVKLLDFGIARVLEAGGEADVTAAGRVLTPAYASPEQRRGAPVATASDVYQLGLLLHELLVGVRHRAELRPSAAVTEEAAAARGTTAEHLRARLRGDLDVIVQHALEEEPSRRYPSAEALAADLKRHRGAMPVLARPQSRGYRVGRFVRRHRAGVALGVLLAVLTIGSAAALAVAGRTAARERDRARAERDRAEATVELLEGLFSAADPLDDERLDTLRARDLLARGVERADSDLADQPLVRAGLLQAIGQAYIRIGMHEVAIPILERALALRLADGAPGVDVAETEHSLGQGLHVHGRHQEAEHYLRRALARRRRAGAPQGLAVANTQAALAEVLQAVGRNPEAEELLRSALASRSARLGDRSSVVADNHAGIAGVLLEQGRLEDAELAYREAIAAYGDLPRPAAGQFRALGGLGFLYAMQGRHADAEAMLRQSVALIESRLGPDHWRMSLDLTTLASSLRRQGKLDEAEATLRRALAISPRRPQDRAITLGTLASVLADRGDAAGAVAAQREAVEILEAAYGPDDPVTAASRAKLQQFGGGAEGQASGRAGPAGHDAHPSRP